MKTGPVKIWEEVVTIPTYAVGKPDKSPMFLEKRVYQGSSGSVYPLPVIETIENEKKDVQYHVVFLENDYLKIMVMPSLGGRIQMAYDKTNDFYFVYYNHVIKPALVGLTGPWISGGIEFNWPQHHRPSTFDPVDYSIKDNPDGSKTLWVSEIERMFRTRGMAGFTLHPDKAYLEINVNLYNRTAQPQTFLWWANPAMHVNDNYQSIFPPDVHAVFDHGKRDVSTFPIATGEYYKMDYSAGVDISRFKNIPVPTSFMAAESKYDFMGGYDHGRRAGMLHFADHHVSPGKKQWVWGCGDFGDAWHRNLTDEDGPYVELMTGVYTDNQPDFSWLMPYEEKSFTQYFFPYKDIGAVKNATCQVAVNLEFRGNQAFVGVYVTSAEKNLTIQLSGPEKIHLKETIDLDPTVSYLKTVELSRDQNPEDLTLSVYDSKGRLMVSFHPEPSGGKAVPDPADAIGDPEAIESIEALYLAGLHLEQYRHATYRPAPYYREGLKRDPGDIRCNNALGMLLYRQGQFEKAEAHFRRAIKRLTKHNPNPYDGEPYYNLGLCLFMQEKLDSAYDAFYKATWNAAMQDAAYFALAQIAAKQGDFQLALEHADKSLIRNTHNHKARHLKTMLLRIIGEIETAEKEALIALGLDALDFGAMYELYLIAKTQQSAVLARQRLSEFTLKMRGSVHTYLEIALDYINAGSTENASELLKSFVEDAASEGSVYPMVYYYLGCLEGEDYFKKARNANPDYCFPHRLESIGVLRNALDHNPNDAKALYYLGNLWYSKQQYDLAIEVWEKSTRLDDMFPTVHRNLGLAYYNKRNDAAKARKAYEKAYSLDCSDARVLYELDQLYKKIGKSPQERLMFMELHPEVVKQRDDLYIEFLWLLNQTRAYQKALDLLEHRIFHPWEGGEGKTTGAYLFSLTEIAKEQIEEKEFQAAIETLSKTETFPPNLAEGKLHGRLENDIQYYKGLAYERLGDSEKAKNCFLQATQGLAELGNAMYYNDQPPEQIYYQGLAYKKLDKGAKAMDCFNRLLSYGQTHYDDDVKIDFFAVSLPDFLIFDEDLNAKNKIHCHYLMGLGQLGLKQTDKARQAFEAILKVDPAHTGAIVHLDMTASALLDNNNIY
jgi:tetratricopeptide (TPR) repeat protein